MRQQAWCAIAIAMAVGAAGCSQSQKVGQTGGSRAATAIAPAPLAGDGGAVHDVGDAVKALGDSDPAVRARAAQAIRDAIAKDPRASGDPGEKHWKGMLAAIAPGITTEQLLKATGGTTEGAVSSGQTTTAIIRLDDYWVVQAYFDNPDKLRAFGTLSRSARSVWVEPPKAFTGVWVTYFVNGVPANEIEYAGGVYRRFRSYYDGGQLVYEHVYVNGMLDGPEIGWHRNGTKAYEGRHAAGKNVGKWTHWYASGKLESERSYIDGELDGPSIQYREDGTKVSRIDYKAGKETGQAAWGEQGELLYARGTASDAK
jgi:hypothetical protein